MKALAAEMVRNFGRRLAPLGVTVRELTGDMQLTKAEIHNTQVHCWYMHVHACHTKGFGSSFVCSLVTCTEKKNVYRLKQFMVFSVVYLICTPIIKQLHTCYLFQMIVTTPEKWDVVTRKATGDVQLAQIVRLLIIDEVHLLHEDRGAVIESLVARTLRQVHIAICMELS